MAQLPATEERRRELAAQFAEYRSILRAAPFLTVGELLERWLAAQHDWRPSTWSSARSNVKALTGPIAGRRVSSLRPEAVREAMARWRLRAPESPSFRAAFGFSDRPSGGPIQNRSSSAIRSVRCGGHPGRAPACTCLSLTSSHSSRRPRGSPKRPRERSTGHRARCSSLHKAEQVRLLVRLAADSGARRGELVALRFSDLDGRVLTIERGVSAEEVGPTKTRAGASAHAGADDGRALEGKRSVLV